MMASPINIQQERGGRHKRPERERPLPANTDAERFVLGSILLDDAVFPEGVTTDCFVVERHRRIFRRMLDLRARGERVDHVTVANELKSRGEAEHDTLSYLISLDDGLPRIPNLDSYIRILREHATRRQLMAACQHLSDRAALGSEDLAEIIASGQELFSAGVTTGQAYRSIDDIPPIAECGSTDIEYIRPELPRGAVVALTGDSGSGKSTLATAWARDAWLNRGVPALFLDRENPIGVISDRLARLSMEDGPGIRFWGGWLPQEAPQPDSPIIRAWAKEHRGLIVVDSFSAFLEGDQNDASIVRTFMHRVRRLADAGATPLLIHHDGKAETAKDYRGSSDFKAAIDAGYHVTNFDGAGRLGKLVLRPFKSRMGSAGEIVYEYGGGRFVRGGEAEVSETVSQRLTELLRLNPGIGMKRFTELAAEAGLGRNRAQAFITDGVLSGAVKRKTGLRNLMQHYLAGSEAQNEF